MLTKLKQISESLKKVATTISIEQDVPVEKVASEKLDSQHVLNFLKFFSSERS